MSTVLEEFAQMLKDSIDAADAAAPGATQYLELFMPMEIARELYDALKPTVH